MRSRHVGAIAVAVVHCQSPASPAATTPTPSPKTDAPTQAVDLSVKRKGFNVVRRYRRGKAQLCGYTLNGYRYVLTRANSRKARTRLTYRLRIGEWDPIDDQWDAAYPARKRAKAKRGKARHVDTAGGPLRPRYVCRSGRDTAARDGPAGSGTATSSPVPPGTSSGR